MNLSFFSHCTEFFSSKELMPYESSEYGIPTFELYGYKIT